MTGTSLAPLARVLWRLLDQERIDPAVVFREAQLARSGWTSLKPRSR